VNCRGKWTIRAFQRVLNGFEIPYRVIHDADAEGGAGANAAILGELGGDGSRRRVHDPDFEQQVFGERASRDKPWNAKRKIDAMVPVSDDLVAFLEFATGCAIAELA